MKVCDEGGSAMTLNRRDLLVAGSGMSLALARPALAQNTGPGTPTAPPGPPASETSEPTVVVPDNEKKLMIITLRDLETEAQKLLTPANFAFVAGGAGDEWTMRENLAAFNRWVICPDYLTGTSDVDTTTTLLGIRLSYPAITAPVGLQQCVHAKKEAPAVKGTAMAGTLFVAASTTGLSLEEVAEASDGPKWFQFYVPQTRAFAIEMLQRAKASGYKAIVFTVDTHVFGNRERVTRLEGQPVPRGVIAGNVAKTPGLVDNAGKWKSGLDWSDVELCRDQTGLPIILKSILSPAMALEAVRRGCAAVWLSNHGGRQLDNTPSALSVLPRVASAVKGRVPIIVDGGVLRGTDVFRALALGANAVALGRPILYGSALGGAQGVQAVHGRLKFELALAMRLAGTRTIKSITRDRVMRAEAWNRA
jgi:L-lactate oxidase